MKIGYYKELDGIRGLAALMIMVFHFFQHMETADPALLMVRKYAMFGQTGVSLFFVLSGFLITRILIATKNTVHFFRSFYFRRALRIFPLYYLFLIIYYFIVPYINGSPVAAFNDQIYYWIYLQNFATTFNWASVGPRHFWSLAVEEHFYLFWPLLIYFFRIKDIGMVSAFIIGIAFIVRIIMVNQHYEVFYFTFARMDELAIGAILALLEIKGLLIPKNSKKFLLSFIIIILPTLSIWTLFGSSGNQALQVFKYILISFSYFAFIGYIITSNKNNYLKKIMELRPFQFSGKISYGLYVYHPLCFSLLPYFFRSGNVFLNLTGSFILTYLLATISYYLYELQFLRLKRFFAYDSKK